MTNKIPDDGYALIIGAMKCGTSSLFSYLEGHPEICTPTIKEPEYFSENQGHGIRVDRYQDLWNFDSAAHKYALEASTGYTKYPYEPNVPRNIHRYKLRPKFIYIIRNPFQRIESHFNYMQRADAWRLSIRDKHLLDTSDYFLQLEQYRKYFPIRDILLLDFEDLKGNPSQLIRKVYRFLDLTDDYLPATYEAKNKTHVLSSADRMLMRTGLSGLLGRLPEPLKRVGKRLALRMWPPPGKRVLTMTERNVIFNKLGANMINLMNVYGFGVRKWGFGN